MGQLAHVFVIGKRGPNLRSRQLHHLHGGSRADRHNREQEPIASGVLLEPAAWLGELPAQRFREIIATAQHHLLRPGVHPRSLLSVFPREYVDEATEASAKPENNYLVGCDRSRGRVVTNHVITSSTASAVLRQPPP